MKAILALLFLCVNVFAFALPEIPYYYSDPTAHRTLLLQKLNQIRRTNGLSPLVAVVDLATVAQFHGEDMFRRSYRAHENPEGEDQADRVRRIQPRLIFLQCRENLAFLDGTNYFPTMSELIEQDYEGLMNSPGHRANILSTDVMQVGFGVVVVKRGDSFKSIMVQVFADIAGRWERPLPRILRSGDQFLATVNLPAEFFISSKTSPSRMFTDPQAPETEWRGGLPLRTRRVERRLQVTIPPLPNGDYDLKISRAGQNEYFLLRRLSLRAAP